MRKSKRLIRNRAQGVAAKAPCFDLDALLAQMKPDQFPDEHSFGKPVGKEIW
jgi:antitoxin component of MazEF toxin-antitoxin module